MAEEQKKTVVIKVPRANSWMIISVVLAVLLVLGFAGYLPGFSTTGMVVLGSDEATQSIR